MCGMSIFAARMLQNANTCVNISLQKKVSGSNRCKDKSLLYQPAIDAAIRDPTKSYHYKVPMSLVNFLTTMR